MRPLTDEAIERLLVLLAEDRVPGQERELDLSPWGGAYTRVAADATAFGHRDPTLLGEARRPRSRRTHPRAIWPAREPGSMAHGDRFAYGARVRVFPNFADPELDDWGHAYYGPNYERLLDVKVRYDADNVFRFRQSIPVP